MPNYRLRLFFDTGSGICFWSADEQTARAFGYAVRPEALPLAPELCLQLERAMAFWDTATDWDDPGGPSRWSAAQENEFWLFVGLLLERVRWALGNDFVVVAGRPGSGPR